jgi:hypothetical protein
MIWSEKRNPGSVAAGGLAAVFLTVDRHQAFSVREQAAIPPSPGVAGACPECGGRLIRSGICFSCLSCGWGGCG